MVSYSLKMYADEEEKTTGNTHDIKIHFFRL